MTIRLGEHLSEELHQVVGEKIREFADFEEGDIVTAKPYGKSGEDGPFQGRWNGIPLEVDEISIDNTDVVPTHTPVSEVENQERVLDADDFEDYGDFYNSIQIGELDYSFKRGAGVHLPASLVIGWDEYRERYNDTKIRFGHDEYRVAYVQEHTDVECEICGCHWILTVHTSEEKVHSCQVCGREVDVETNND